MDVVVRSVIMMSCKNKKEKVFNIEPIFICDYDDAIRLVKVFNDYIKYGLTELISAIETCSCAVPLCLYDYEKRDVDISKLEIKFFGLNVPEYNKEPVK